MPIVVKGTQEDIDSACLRRSYLWQNITHLTLTKNLRLEQNGSEEEKHFAPLLHDIGHGHGLTPDNDMIKLRDGMQTDSDEALIDIIYHELSNLATAPPPKYFLERSILLESAQDGIPFHLKQKQFPIPLVFILTINRSQGKSIKYLDLDLHFPVFAHDQLYVALLIMYMFFFQLMGPQIQLSILFILQYSILNYHFSSACLLFVYLQYTSRVLSCMYNSQLAMII